MGQSVIKERIPFLWGLLKRKCLVWFAFRCQSPISFHTSWETFCLNRRFQGCKLLIIRKLSLRTEIPHSAIQTSCWFHSPWEENGLVVICKGSHVLSIIACCLLFENLSHKSVLGWLSLSSWWTSGQSLINS